MNYSDTSVRIRDVSDSSCSVCSDRRWRKEEENNCNINNNRNNVNHGYLAVISLHTCWTAVITWIGLPWRSGLFYMWAAMETWGWDILLQQIHLFSPINGCTGAIHLKTTFMNCAHRLCHTCSLLTVEEGGLDGSGLLSLKPPSHSRHSPFTKCTTPPAHKAEPAWSSLIDLRRTSAPCKLPNPPVWDLDKKG